MNKIESICTKYNIALCYLFGSQTETGEAILKGEKPKMLDSESDIDFGVLFNELPQDPLKIYASLSVDLQEITTPFKADLLFLHEVDHLIQLEVIKGVNIYSASNDFRASYEEMVMMYASDELEIFKLNERDMFEAIENGYFEFKYEIN